MTTRTNRKNSSNYSRKVNIAIEEWPVTVSEEDKQLELPAIKKQENKRKLEFVKTGSEEDYPDKFGD